MRGEGSFGDFLYGSCGYYNKPRSKQRVDYDDLSLPLDGVAALADVNPDFPGSCGRCYEVRCAEGLVQANDHKPLWTGNHFYMPDRNGSVLDTVGRTFPGNPAHPEGKEYVRCWNESSVVVKIVDDCPSMQWKGRREREKEGERGGGSWLSNRADRFKKKNEIKIPPPPPPTPLLPPSLRRPHRAPNVVLRPRHLPHGPVLLGV